MNEKATAPFLFLRQSKKAGNTHSGIMYFPTEDHPPDDFFCWSYILGVPPQDIS